MHALPIQVNSHELNRDLQEVFRRVGSFRVANEIVKVSGMLVGHYNFFAQQELLMSVSNHFKE